MNKKIIAWVFVMVILLATASYAAEEKEGVFSKIKGWFGKGKEAAGKAVEQVTGGADPVNYEEINTEYASLKTLITQTNGYEQPAEGENFETFYGEKKKKLDEVIAKANLVAGRIGDKKNIERYYEIYTESMRVKEEGNNAIKEVDKFYVDDLKDGIDGKYKKLLSTAGYEDPKIKQVKDVVLTGKEKEKVETVDDKVSMYTKLMRLVGLKKEADAVDEGAKGVKKYITFIKWGAILFAAAIVIFILSMLFKPVKVVLKVGKFITTPLWAPALALIKAGFKRIPFGKMLLFFPIAAWVVIRNILYAFICLFSKKIETKADVKKGKAFLKFLRGRGIAFKTGLLYSRGSLAKKSKFLTEEERKGLPPKEQRELIRKRASEEKKLIRERGKEIDQLKAAQKKKLMGLYMENEKMMRIANTIVELVNLLNQGRIQRDEFEKRMGVLVAEAKKEKGNIIDLEIAKQELADLNQQYGKDRTYKGSNLPYSEYKEMRGDMEERIRGMEAEMRGGVQTESNAAPRLLETETKPTMERVELASNLRRVEEKLKNLRREYLNGTDIDLEKCIKEIGFLEKEKERLEGELGRGKNGQ